MSIDDNYLTPPVENDEIRMEFYNDLFKNEGEWDDLINDTDSVS